MCKRDRDLSSVTTISLQKLDKTCIPGGHQGTS